MADFQYGLTCIVTGVKTAKEVNMKFVLDKKQYTVTFKDRKSRYDDRNFTKLLRPSDALKASAWNIPVGPPGTKKNSWYISDVWTPRVAGMEKKRIPEPTLTVVCKVTYKLGKEFLVCELGKHFVRDVIILPRSVIESVPKNTQPEIGDYLLVCALFVWEQQGTEERARLIPIWAHWNKLNCTQSSTAHLNIIECGPENETLLIPDQIPSMWAVVQNVYKKSLQVYVPCISTSVSVPHTAIYQYISAMHILEGDWVHLWLTPQVSGQAYNHVSDVTTWTCSHCCWFGPRAKKRYEVYVQHRLNSRYHKPGLLNDPELQSSHTGDHGKTKQKSSQDSQSPSDIIGIGKVRLIKGKSAILKCKDAKCKKDHVFHLGMMTVYGIKMINIKKAKITDIVNEGSEVRYRMNGATKNLRTVWIGPEVVTFKNLNFLPQLSIWMKKRNLDGDLTREMMKELSDACEAQTKSATDTKAVTQKTDASDKTKENMVKSKGNEILEVDQLGSGDANQLLLALDNPSLWREKGTSADNEKPSEIPMGNSCEGQLSVEIDDDFRYSKEEEEEIEKLWWSDDSEEDSDDELKPLSNRSPVDTGEDLTEGLGVYRNGENVSVIHESGEDSKNENALPLSKSYSVGENMDDECKSNRDTESSDEISVMVTTVHPHVAAEPENKESSPQETDNKAVTKSKGEDANNSSTLVVMMELTKFLLLKGKASSVAEAGEVSAEFVLRLESALGEIAPKSPVTQSVGTQTEITGPIKSFLSTSDPEVCCD